MENKGEGSVGIGPSGQGPPGFKYTRSHADLMNSPMSKAWLLELPNTSVKIKLN